MLLFIHSLVGANCQGHTGHHPVIVSLFPITTTTYLKGTVFSMSKSQHKNTISLFILAAIISLNLAGALAQPSNVSVNRQDLVIQINNLLQDGRHTEALILIRQYTDQYPGNPRMLYNLACVENAAGNSSAAISALTQSVAAGFDDFHQAQNDPDLQSLAGEPGFQALILEHELALEQHSQAKGFTTNYNTWSAEQFLLPHASPSGNTGSEMTMKVSWQIMGLAIEVSGSAPRYPKPAQANKAPWSGGDGVFATIAIEDGGSSGESENTFHFVFGRVKGSPTGALYIDSQHRWQQVKELAPKIRIDNEGETFFYSFTLPWKILDPFHPLVDTILGLNVATRQASTSGPLVNYLIEDPAAFQPYRTWHRYVPVEFDASNIEEARLHGRISHSISGNKPLSLDLRIVSPTAGSGSLRIDFLDNQHYSVLDETRADMALELEQGTNTFTWPVDFSSLRTGPYLIQASVDFPGGESLTWETPVLHLQPGWIEKIGEYLDNIPPGETETVALIEKTVIEAISVLQKRRNPQALGKTLHDLLEMADRADRFNSILPQKGSFLLSYPGTGNEQQQLCSVFFPPGYRDAATILPVLVLNNYRGFELRMADRMDKFYEHWANAPDPLQRAGETVPVYIFPHLKAGLTGIGQDGALEAANSAQWAAKFFGVEEIAVVGIDACLGDALNLAIANETSLAALLLVAGQEVRIWPEAQLAFLKQKLPAPPGDLPVKWMDFPYETKNHGQATDILAAMQENNWNINKTESVKGPLGLTQATDRIILWSENLR